MHFKTSFIQEETKSVYSSVTYFIIQTDWSLLLYYPYHRKWSSMFPLYITNLSLVSVCLFLKQGHRYTNLASNLLCCWGWLWTFNPPASTSKCLHQYTLSRTSHMQINQSTDWATSPGFTIPSKEKPLSPFIEHYQSVTTKQPSKHPWQ